jgi:hypothetical protein
VVADLDAAGAERVAAGLACPSPLGVGLGVTDGAAVAGLVERVEDRLGPIDLAPRMAARGRGHLLLMASAAGLLTNMDSTPYRAATSSTPLASGRLADLMVRRRPGCAGHPGDGGRVLHEVGEALAAGLDR